MSTTTVRPRTHREASLLRHQDPEPAHLPYATLELTLPAIETLWRIKSLVDFVVFSLGAYARALLLNTHAVLQRLAAAAIPAAVFVATFTTTFLYRLFLFSLAGGNFAMGLSRMVLRFVGKRVVSRRLKRQVEMELYSFLLGPGIVILKALFWMGCWGAVGFVISAPLWLVSAA